MKKLGCSFYLINSLPFLAKLTEHLISFFEIDVVTCSNIVVIEILNEFFSTLFVDVLVMAVLRIIDCTINNFLTIHNKLTRATGLRIVIWNARFIAAIMASQRILNIHLELFKCRLN